MRRLMFVALMALAIPLGGCADQLQKLENVWSVVTSTSVSPKAVVIAANTFNALEATATNYLKLKRCSATSGPICRDPTATATIIPAIRSGRVARANLEQFMKDHPGQLGPSGLYDALQGAIDTVQGIINQYGIGVAQ